MVELLPVLRTAFPNVTGFNTVATIVQANADGYRVVLNNEEKTDVFVKQIHAAKYTAKSWPDFRRSMMYARTEVRFYKEIMPDLMSRGFHGAPKIYASHYNLQGLIEEDEKATDQSKDEPLNWSSSLDAKGGYIIMESIDEPYFQDSPISLDQAKETLAAVAGLHAAAWEDRSMLTKVEHWLSRGSYHLKTRNIKELASMEKAWEHFSTHFSDQDPELFGRTKDIGTRIKSLAEYISEEISPGPNDPYATISHGDFKSMNCFLPKNGNRGVLLVDFASTGVGLGMSDVAMHIHHAVRPELLANGGEEELVDHYLATLNNLLGPDSKYPRDVGLRHYRLAVADYFRFFLGRFWKSSTPESFEQKKNSKNTALINRDMAAALAFLDRVDKYIDQIEKERSCKTD